MRLPVLFAAMLAVFAATPGLANCPDPFNGVDVGAPALAGHTSVVAEGSAYDLSAAGRDIYARSDQFHFAFRVHTGDFDLRVRVASLTAVNEWSKAGLMARESMAAGSREASVLATPAAGYEFQYRASTGAFVQKLDSAARVSYPNTWVRLARAGNVFTSYTSADGERWALLGSATLALPATVFLGMAATSHDVAQPVLAEFRDLAAAGAPPPPPPPPPPSPDSTAPSVPAGLTATALSASQIGLSWSASTDDVGVTGYRLLRDGVLVAGTSALAYTDSGLAPATRYTYTVAAVDAAGNTSAPSASAAATTAQPSGANRSPLGTNLSAVRDWSQEWAFVDAFRASRPWISGAGLDGAWDDGRALATDADGWVTSLQSGQVARTLLFWDLNGTYPGGTYVVRYDGEGSLAYQGAATKVAGAPGRDVLQVNPADGGIVLNITATNPANPLRNIRVLMPGGICAGDPFRYAADASACADPAAFMSFEANYAGIVFHPSFLERLRGYRLLRFMDWGDTNDSAQSAWSARAKPGDARWSAGKGVPVEVMVDLANRLGADAWFTLPHLADDGYVREYARLVSQGLRADLKAYVEYSNEVWNGQFAQSRYAEERGLALGLSADPFLAQIFFYSRRSVEVFDLWRAEFPDPARLVRVMASQAANSWISEQLLDYQDARLKTDALAVAPYFGSELGTSVATAALTLDLLFAQLQAVSLPEALAWINAQAAVARLRGLPLVAYEGGQHLTGVGGLENDDALNRLFDAANRDPRMAELYRAYLGAWKAAGATLFVHYTSCEGYSKWGRWGALEHLEQPRAQAPKFDALQSFIEQNPAWW